MYGCRFWFSPLFWYVIASLTFMLHSSQRLRKMRQTNKLLQNHNCWNRQQVQQTHKKVKQAQCVVWKSWQHPKVHAKTYDFTKRYDFLIFFVWFDMIWQLQYPWPCATRWLKVVRKLDLDAEELNKGVLVGSFGRGGELGRSRKPKQPV